jgi:EAL domain-containing protein (putative c-di-GMP-specific phosphodiesterase class I)
MAGRIDLHVGFAFAWADVLLETGMDLRIRRAEGAISSLFGHDGAALAGRRLPDLIAESDRPALDGLSVLAAGTRLTLDRVRLAGAKGARPATVALSALCPEAPKDVLCVALRAVPPTAMAAAPKPPKTASAERIAAFAEQAGPELAHDPNTGVSVVALTGLEALKPRLSQTDADHLGDILTAVVGEAIGHAAPWVALDEGAYAYLGPAEADSDAVGAALADATRALDPDGEGAGIERGVARPAAGIDESDLVNGLICSLSRFCQGDGPEGAARPSLTDFAANFSRLVADGVSEVRAFADLVAEGAFDVALQPIVDARRGTLHHYEALCRFPEGGSPAARLAFAERAQMIHQFDLAMLRKVAAWLGKQPRNRSGPLVAVNVSGHSLTRPGFLEAVERELDDSPWLQGRLLIEITETLPIRDRPAGNALIQRLRRRRIPVCIDDFGAGAASFQYLADLQVDFVKFDGSTVLAALRGARGQAFLSALTAFCRRLGIKTIAEMVETREHLTAVRGCGVDFLQGYLFGEPSADADAFRPIPNGDLITGRTAASGRR